MLDEVYLVGMTGDSELDMALYGVVGLSHMAFPGRVHSIYLLGTQATREAVTASDVDVVVVFKDRLLEGEAERFQHYLRFCWLLSRVPLDLSVAEEARLREEGAVNLKLSSLLLQGEDLRERIPLPPLEKWVRECMHKPYQFIERSRPRGEGEPLVYPLGLPYPDGELYGYDYRQLKGPDGELRPSIKELVTLTGRVASALVAVRAGVYVSSKRMAVQSYHEHVGDEWAPLLEELYACRQKWGYMVPSEPAERARLRELCARVLELENHFLGLYRDFLVAELERGTLEDRVLAAERLGQVLYPADEEVARALERQAATGPEPLRQAATESLARLRRVSSRAPAA